MFIVKERRPKLTPPPVSIIAQRPRPNGMADQIKEDKIKEQTGFANTKRLDSDMRGRFGNIVLISATLPLVCVALSALYRRFVKGTASQCGGSAKSVPQVTSPSPASSEASTCTSGEQNCGDGGPSTSSGNVKRKPTKEEVQQALEAAKVEEEKLQDLYDEKKEETRQLEHTISAREGQIQRAEDDFRSATQEKERLQNRSFWSSFKRQGR